MTLAAYVFSAILRCACYIVLFMDIAARMITWFKAEDTFTGRFVCYVSDVLAFPFRRLLKRFTDRHPTAVDIPRLFGSVFVLLVASLAEL